MKRMIIVSLILMGCTTRPENQILNENQTPLPQIYKFVGERTFLIIASSSKEEGPGSIPYGFGNAFLVDANLLITARHIIYNERLANPTINIRTHAGNVVQAKVVKTDEESDLALLAAPVAGKILALRNLTQTDTQAYIVGLHLMNLYNMLQAASFVHESRVIISTDDASPRILLTGAISPGMSGSPLLDENANVVGILTSAIPNTPFIFAIKSDRIKNLVDGYRGGKSVKN